MSNLGNKYKVGALVIAGSAILVLGLLSLGALKHFRKTYEFCTVVSSSVQGLDKGSKVKLKGVPVGEVSKIQIMENLNDIIITMKFDREAFARSYVDKLEANNSSGKLLSDEDSKELLDKGLRCELKYDGITGNLYVEIDFFDPEKNPGAKFELPPDTPLYIPSVRSTTISSLMEEAQKAITKIGKVNFEGLSNRLETFLDGADKLLNDKRVTSTLDQVTTITANLDQITQTLKGGLTAERLETFIKDIKETIDNVNGAVNAVRNSIEAAKIPETAEKGRNILDSSERFVKGADALRSELAASLVKLNATLDAARTLLDYIEKNPNSMISGKPEKPLVDH